MTLETVVGAMQEAGHFPQLRESGHEKWVETAFRRDESGRLRAPVVTVAIDDLGRWVLSGYRGACYQVPDERKVPEAAIAVLRAMDYCMHFSPEVVRDFDLIELASTEFESNDE